MIWCVFSIFSYEVDDSWGGCVDFIWCLAENFAGFLGFLLGFLEDFIGKFTKRFMFFVWLGFFLFFIFFFLFFLLSLHARKSLSNL